MMIVDQARAPKVDPTVAASADPWGCLNHLSAATTRDGLTVGVMVAGAPIAHLSARTLRTMGIAVEAQAGSKFSAVAEAHPALSAIFAETLWCGAWAEALGKLPGAVRGPRMLFGRCYSAAILFPRTTWEIPF